MKNLLFVLFLGLLATSIAKKPVTLANRINTVYRMLEVSKFEDEYTPSKYAKNLLDDKQDVTSLSIKVQLCRECVSAVLDHLTFPEAVINKVNTAKVSMVMDAMDLFVAIAKGAKTGKDLSKLRTIFPELTDEQTMSDNIAKDDNVKDAVDFIKDTIHPGSVQNMLRKSESGSKSTNSLGMKVGEKVGSFSSEKESSEKSNTANFKLVAMPQKGEEDPKLESKKDQQSSTSDGEPIVQNPKRKSSMRVPTRVNPRFMSDEELNNLFKEHPELKKENKPRSTKQETDQPVNIPETPSLFMEVSNKKVLTEEELDQ